MVSLDEWGVYASFAPQMAAGSGGKLQAKMEAHSSPEAEGWGRTFLFLFIYFFYDKLSHLLNKESGGLG